jgi:hypothetical protein
MPRGSYCWVPSVVDLPANTYERGREGVYVRMRIYKSLP